MTEKTGHFEKGVWVEDKPAAAPAPAPSGAATIDQKLTDVKKTVISSIDTAMTATHDLIAKPENKQYIETTIKEAQSQFQKSFDALLGRAKVELEKTKVELERSKAELDRKVAEMDKSAFDPEKIRAEVDRKVAELNKRWPG
jgi:hypothetical protein